MNSEHEKNKPVIDVEVVHIDSTIAPSLSDPVLGSL